MSSWKQTVQAQMLFSQKVLSQIEGDASHQATVLERKQQLNGVILCLKELWLCWLNEWADLLEPKRKSGRISSWQGFLDCFSGLPDLDPLLEEKKRPDSWVAGFIELEKLCSYDWLENLVAGEGSESERDTGSFDALSLVQVDVRPCSVLRGRRDIERMLTELKQYIVRAREQHSEW